MSHPTAKQKSRPEQTSPGEANLRGSVWSVSEPAKAP